MSLPITYSVMHHLAGVHMEVDRQIEKWGDQSHPNGTSYIEWGDYSNIARAQCDDAARAGELTWAYILNEEFAEAMAEEDPELLYKELEQVAAVCVSWMKDLKRGEALTA